MVLTMDEDGRETETITKGFGNLIYGEENINTIKDLLDELGIKKDNKRINK